MTARTGAIGGYELAWRLAVYLIVMAVGMLPLFAGSALSPYLVRTGLLSGGQLGLAWGLFFGVAALCAPLVGRVLDLRGATPVAVAVFICTGVALIVLSTADGLATVLLAYVLGGVSVAGAFASTNAALGSPASAARGSLHIGIAHAGTQVGALAAGALLPAIAMATSWQAAMVTTSGVAAIGLLLLALGSWYGFDSDRCPPTERTAVTIRGHNQGLPAALYVYAIVTSGAATVSVGFLPLYAYESIGLPAAMAAATLSVSAVLAVVGKVFWGLAAGRAATWWTPLLLLGMAALLDVILLLVGPALRPAMWVGIALVGLCGQCWAVVTMSGVVKLSTSASMGRASGRILAGGFAGSALLPPLFGLIVDFTGGYWSAWAGLAIAYLLALGAVAATSWQRADRQPAAGSGLL